MLTKNLLAFHQSRVFILTLQPRGVVKMAIEAHVRELSDKHAKLDIAIQAEIRSLSSDDVQVAALKRQKLKLKEELETLRRRH
jgi:hypothetical protein